MTVAPFRAGQFVWTAFPQTENPLTPGPRHVGYVVAVASASNGYSAMVAYTTSQPWSGRLPPGVYRFTQEQAAAMGQATGFVLDLRRIAFLPVELAWFPDLNQLNRGVLGQVSNSRREELEAKMKELHSSSPDVFERLGPKWR